MAELVMTSSPSPIFVASNAKCRPLVQEFTATELLAPTYIHLLYLLFLYNFSIYNILLVNRTIHGIIYPLADIIADGFHLELFFLDQTQEFGHKKYSLIIDVI